MEKRGLVLTFISVFLSLMLVNIVSAQFYGGFSLSNMLNSVDPSTMILGTIFIISFAFLNFSLSKFFRGNAGIAGIVAFSISLLITWGINRTGFDYSSLFFNIFFFIPEDLLYTLVPFILLGLIILGVVKIGFGETLAILGGFLLLITIFTDLVYESGLVGTIGAVLLILGGWLWARKKKPGLDSRIGSGISNVKGKWSYARDRKAAEKEDYERSREKQKASDNIERRKQEERIRGEEGQKQAKEKREINEQRDKLKEINGLERKKQKYINYINKLIKSLGGHVPKKGTPPYRNWKIANNEVSKLDNEINKLRR